MIKALAIAEYVMAGLFLTNGCIFLFTLITNLKSDALGVGWFIRLILLASICFACVVFFIVDGVKHHNS